MLRIFKKYYPIRNIFFVLGELVVIYISGYFASCLILGFGVNSLLLHLKILLISFVCQTCLYYNDLYDLSITDSYQELGIRLLQSLGASAIILAGIYTVVAKANIGLEVFCITIVFDICFIVFWRMCYTIILKRHIFDEKIILLGNNDLAENIIKEITERRDCGYELGGMMVDGARDRLARSRCIQKRFPAIRLLGALSEPDAWEHVYAMGIRKIIVAIDSRCPDFPAAELLQCRVRGIDVLEGPTFYEMLTGKLNVDYIKPEWLIFSDGFTKSRIRRVLKRVIDLSLCLILLVFALPVICLTALMIKLDRSEPVPEPRDIWNYFIRRCRRDGREPAEVLLSLVRADIESDIGPDIGSDIGPDIGSDIESDIRMNKDTDMPVMPAASVWKEFYRKCEKRDISGSGHLLGLMKTQLDRWDNTASAGRPVIFSQERTGKDGRIYRIHKFRSMIVNAERFSGPVWAGENDKRITRLGRFLRATRIDELPQLWNVLKGEMSFVGPRPERDFFIRQLAETIPYYRERLTVKPGLTGWAQVSYGYGASEDDAREKLNYDLFYIKNMSIPMDLMIVLKTIKIVIFGKGR